MFHAEKRVQRVWYAKSNHMHDVSGGQVGGLKHHLPYAVLNFSETSVKFNLYCCLGLCARLSWWTHPKFQILHSDDGKNYNEEWKLRHTFCINC